MRVSRTLFPALLVVASAPMFAAGGATAVVGAPTASATATASAKIYQPISIAKASDLNFGAMIATPTAGTVRLDPAGVRTASGGAVLASAAGVSAASFDVAGEPNTSFAVGLPGSIQITSGANSMTVDNFTTGASAYLLDSAGASGLSVGANLSVAANQPAGLYSGSFSVIVAYN
jgi:hypothetical protein